MVYGTEKPLTKRGRMIIVIVLWAVVAVPLFIGLAFMMSFWVLVLIVPAIWATWDYLKRGDFFGSVDQSFRVQSGVVDALSDKDPKKR